MSRANTLKDVQYYLDGINFKDYGVYVSGSKGITASLKPKKILSASWDNYHGETIDLSEPPIYEARDLSLECFLEAPNKESFLMSSIKFLAAFNKAGTRRLKIEVDPSKPLVYEVFATDKIDMKKKWSNTLMVGSFSLSLREAEPIKRVLGFKAKDSSMKANITLSSSKLLNIYWGDGAHSFDIYGTNKQVSHTYKQPGNYEIIITGLIEEIKDFQTNTTIIWNKL